MVQHAIAGLGKRQYVMPEGPPSAPACSISLDWLSLSSTPVGTVDALSSGDGFEGSNRKRVDHEVTWVDSATMFTFCSLLGAQSESAASQSLLELDGGVKILIDVGWDELFDAEKLKDLEKQVPTLSLVLLTHATIAHLGAFAHCCKHFPLFQRIPIYATLPVIQLGRTLLQDLYTSTPLASTVIPREALSEASYSYSETISKDQEPNILLQPPNSEEIASYFALINPLKYSQPHQPIPSPWSPPLSGLAITAYNAGHTLGGTIWHIQHGLESIVYAVDWNHAREHVLAGAAWLGGAAAGGAEVIEQLRKPTALICSTRGSERVALAGGRTKRDELLVDMIKSSVGKGGIVLIPTDSSARVLELAYLLEHEWRTESKDEDSPLRTTKLYLASHNIGATMRYTRSMLEWMDDGIIREFEAQAGGQQKNQSQPGSGPFDFQHLRLLTRRKEIDRILNETDNLGRSVGKVIIASDASLEWGFSKDILRKMTDDRRNLVILTEKMGHSMEGGSRIGLARTLWSWWEERRDGVATETSAKGHNLEQVYSGGREVEFREAQRLALDGNDLTVYQHWLSTRRQLQTTLQSGGTSAAALESSADVIDDASSDSSSDSEESDNEQQGKALNMSATMGQANRKKIGLSDEDLGINILLRKQNVHDYDVRGKKGREKMFPVAIRRKRHDDFGEIIRPEDFLRAEERDEVDGVDMRNQPGKFDTKDSLGKKRKIDDIVAPTDRKKNSSVAKRQQLQRNGDRLSPGFDEIGHDIDDLDSLDEAEDEIIGPSKLVLSTETVSINLRLAFVDFSGIHDQRSLHMLIPLIEPRKLILVGGTKNETLSLADECRKVFSDRSESMEERVYTPETGATVDASVDTNAWAIKLTDALVKQLRWQNVKGLGVVTVTGRLEANQIIEIEIKDEGSNKKQKLLQGKVPEQTTVVVAPDIPTLDILPSSMQSATRTVAQPLHVGDLRLADLKRIMQTSGHTAEFRGEGILLIDGSVIVRKLGTGRIEVESTGFNTNDAPGPSFYAVKSKIYEGLAVVAGG
ncbi:beta-lactamase-like protein [Bisporella sp. PMI_857]|nr:beta-lactamase-like protein [Bisporella sp. PMI_857]